MITLALELSTHRGSLALLEGARVLAEQAWIEGVHQQALFRALPALFAQAGVARTAVGLYAVGRGPGSYSGLRMAITAAAAMALPGGQPVHAVSSGEALAAELLAADPRRPVAVVGDARRHSLWLGVFAGEGGEAGVRALQPWRLVGLGELAAALPAEALLVSPDAHRLAPLLAPGRPTHDWPREDSYPSAPAVARLALAQRARGLVSAPLTPIYMHPAVFIPPRPGTAPAAAAAPAAG